MDFYRQLVKSFVDLDEDVSAYVKGYLRDTPRDEYGDNGVDLIDFLAPLLVSTPAELELLENLCRSIECLESAGASSGGGAGGPRQLKLDSPLKMDQMSVSRAAEFVLPQRSTDISLSSTKARFFKPNVDRKKLERAEAKLLKKQEERLAKDMVDPSFKFVDLHEDKTDYNLKNMAIDPTQATGGNRDIKLENFDISLGGKVIMSRASLSLNYGRRYGLIGRNGVGKSTLLRAISRRDINGINKNGKVPDWVRILHVEQEIDGDDITVIDAVLAADAFRTSLISEEQDLQNQLRLLETSDYVAEKDAISARLKDVYLKMQDIEADKAESKAATILSGLGFSADDQLKGTKTFSGGWRMRIALARALFCKPDLLLLDEPTNHLDINAVVWLENYVQTWPNTLIVVSHDRDFLDTVVTDILHMHNARIDQYRGNYTMFLSSREEKRRNQLKEYESQLAYRQHLQAFIDRWRYNAKRAAQAQSKIKVLEKLPPLEPLEDDGVDDGQLTFKWPDPVDKLSPPILLADEVSFAYKTKDENGKINDKPVLEKVSFSVQLDSRIAIVGANGAGKTTLLKLLIRELEPSKGIIQRHGRLRIAYFSQHHMDSLESSHKTIIVSPLSFLAARYPGLHEEEYRKVLGRFGLSGAVALQPMQTLSGGQKSRVVFAMMALNNPHILVLDEVTNHLDIMTIDSLINALNPETGFKGGVLIVSHDTRFIDKVCSELWVCEGGKISKYETSRGSLVLGSQNQIEGS
eukprot:Partr_v1_DN27970_c0_g1_i2_m11086 putative ATP-binding cassette, sub-family F